jgi:hypothetical protein
MRCRLEYANDVDVSLVVWLCKLVNDPNYVVIGPATWIVTGYTNELTMRVLYSTLPIFLEMERG